ncbi:MAG TPA: conjugal transfer protein TrbE [Caulobacteraceae bacterium]|jgi:type IV secretion system protein VirB4|nr:conjugal transfer protein TrbE [Caulobacteraceae bacterium]
MFSLREYSHRSARLSDWLPWGFLIEDGVLLNKDGAYMATLEFRGPDLASATPAILMALRAQINHALKGLGSSWCIHVEAQRRPSPHYPDEGAFPDPISRLIDEERRRDFSREGRFYESRYFITLTMLPAGDRTSKLASMMVEHAPTGTGAAGIYQAALIHFTNRVDSIHDLFRASMPFVSRLTSDELLTYLHSTVSTKPHLVRTPAVPAYLDCLLTDDDLTTGLHPMLGDHHLRVVSVRSFPDMTEPGILDRLDELGIAYRWSSRFLALDKQDALKEHNRYRRLWYQGRKSLMAVFGETLSKSESPHQNPDAVRRAALAESAMGIAAGDYAAFGYYTPTVTLLDRDPDRLAEKARLVESVINAAGFVAKSEGPNAVEAWLGSLPGNPYPDVRRPMISTLSLADLAPMSAVWPGPTLNRHLTEECARRGYAGVQPPLMLARTSGATPFRLNLHQGDVAHTMIVGPTGSGKSVLLNTLALQHLRYPEARVILFDVGASSRAATLLVGGDFYNLSASAQASDLTFQPLADLDDASEMEWAASWVEDLVAGQNVPITPELREEIFRGLKALAGSPARLRTLTELWSLVQNIEVKAALQPFTLQGTFGRLLDSELNAISDANWLAFEMSEIMQSKALFPTLTYIFHALDRLFDGRPTLLVLDEAWLFLGQGRFADRIKDWLKTLRRKNVGVVFATQSLADVANSSIAPSLIESCPTKIYLPNPGALDPETGSQYARFGLNAKQLQLIASATPKREYYFTCADGNRLIDLGLGPVALAVVGSNNRNDQTLMTQLLETYGRNGFTEAFFRAKGLPEIADALGHLHRAAAE